MTKIILASTSKARQYLLKKAGITNFEVKKPLFDEEGAKDQIKTWPIKDQALFLAENKGKQISQNFPSYYVISSDQICSLEDQIIHKSKNQNDAINILTKLNGKTHIQNNATCLFLNGKLLIKHFSPVSLTMKSLTLQQITNYVTKDHPIGCAGAYKFESHGKNLFIKIDGNQDAIIGMDLTKILPIITK